MVVIVFQMSLIPVIVVTILGLLAGYSDAIIRVCDGLPDQTFLCYSNKNLFNKENDVRVGLWL